MKRKDSQSRIGIDGIERSIEVDQRINENIVALLGTDAGKRLMEYLESITIKNVAGPHIGNDELRHREGQRYIVGILSQRIQQGHKEKQRGRS